MASFVLRVTVGLRPCVARPAASLRLSTTFPFAIPKRNAMHFTTLPCTRVVGARATVLRHTWQSLPLLLTAAGIAGAALGISSSSTLHCDGKYASARQDTLSLPPPPKSSVNAYELTFGMVCGICAGVFVKKSARMIAFFLGGLFVVLQYLGSVSLVKVDWARMESRFENLFYTTDALGNRKPPTVRSIWKWIMDFLTADFQPRASFAVGLALGLRVG